MATTVKVASQAKWEPGMQESDLMDALPDGQSRKDEETQNITLVSLGCFCGPKLSFKNIGRGAATLPFDWMRTRHDGLVHFLRDKWDERSNYNGFFEFNSKKVVPGCQMTTYRSYFHSFWHDDPTDPGMHERYKRRIERFNEIDANSTPVLFVRTIPTTQELVKVPELMDLLIERHGKQSFLLLIIDFQKTAQGAAVVEGMDNIMVHFLSGSKHVNQEGLPAPPYGDAVNLALDWIVGRSVSVMQFDNWEAIIKCADHTEWGLNGLGGLYAFELSLEPPQEEAPEPLPDRLPQLAAVPVKKLERDYLLKAPRPEQRPQLRQMQVVPLGFGGLVKATVIAMGIPSPALPFDWIQITDAGLLHFLRKGFEAPIRDGLGAGGQRPKEKRGFFDFATRRQVPQSDLMMSRSHLHCFWHDDPADPQVRKAYEKRFESFEQMARSGDTLLFVRVVATSSELGRAYELTQALSKKFGPQAALLLICDFQSKVGPLMVDTFDDLMVYFLEADAHKTAAPYKKPILTALEWLSGKELRMDIVPDFKALQALADPTNWGLMGLGAIRQVLSRVDSFSAAQCRGCLVSCPYGTDFSFQELNALSSKHSSAGFGDPGMLSRVKAQRQLAFAKAANLRWPELGKLKTVQEKGRDERVDVNCGFWKAGQKKYMEALGRYFHSLSCCKDAKERKDLLLDLGVLMIENFISEEEELDLLNYWDKDGPIFPLGTEEKRSRRRFFHYGPILSKETQGTSKSTLSVIPSQMGTMPPVVEHMKLQPRLRKAAKELATPENSGYLAFEGFSGAPETVEWTPGPEDQWLMDAKFQADKDALAVVSLGYHEFLGKALEMCQLQVETSPFDGAFITGEGVLHFLRNDFNGFLDVAKPMRISGSPFMVRRSSYHSFWDVNPDNRLRQAEINIRSFRHLLGSNRVKLFVRAMATGEELALLGEIHEALCKHSPGALLLAVIGGQDRKTLTVASNYSVLVQFIEEDPIQTGILQSYAEPVRRSMDWAVGKELKAGVVPDFAALKGLLKPLPPAPLVGPGNVPIFEESASTTDESGEGSLSNSSSPGVQMMGSQNLKAKVLSPSRGYAGVSLR